MRIFEKLKTIKKKWIYLGVVLILIIGAVGIGGTVLHERFDGSFGEHVEKSDLKPYYDLLYLENTGSLKLTADQSKALLPLIEKLSTATDETAKSDMLKNIYNQLTPEQYYALINGNAGNEGTKFSKTDKKGGRMTEGREYRDIGHENKLTNTTIKDFVINMLKNQSAK